MQELRPVKDRLTEESQKSLENIGENIRSDFEKTKLEQKVRELES